MIVDKSEYAAFTKLLSGMLNEINTRHKFINEAIALEKPTNAMRAATSHIFQNPALIKTHLSLRRCSYTKDERATLNSWISSAALGFFAVFDRIPHYSVLMKSDRSELILYGARSVQATQDISEDEPFVIETVLLPYHGKIVFDTILGASPVREREKKLLNAYYKHAKETYRIAESLPADEKSLWKNAKWQNPNQFDSIPHYEEIKEIITSFCAEHMLEDLSCPCLSALADLASMRPSPLLSGRARSWACSIVCAIGANNFLFDRSKPWYISGARLAKTFGVAKSTMKARANDIAREMLCMHDLSYTTSASARQILNEHSDMDDFKASPELCSVEVLRF